MNTRLIRLGLSLFGIGGVGITSYLSIKSYEKAKDIPKENHKERFIAWLPPIISGLFTSGCILGSYHASEREILALATGCGYFASKNQKIQQVVREAIGDEKYKEVKKEVDKETEKERPKSPIEKTGYGNEIFIDPIFERKFYCSRDRIKWGFKMANDMIRHNDTVNMNTLYELWGLKKIRLGYEYGFPNRESEEMFGYSLDEMIHYDLLDGLDEDDNEVCWIEMRTTPPMLGYLEV